ncbi:MAG: IS66 family transposase [Candidatus Aenigmarchaeota archaeon]|nr:IS66 family transposase [Candidatus Aenigmarchaeota archaeon]
MHENCVSREEFDRVVAELKKENEELKSKIARYENAHTPPSLRINRYPKPERSGKPLGKPKGSPGGTKILGQPDEVIDVTKEHCKRCGTKLGDPVGYDVKRVLELPKPQKAKIIEYRKAEYGKCLCCGVVNVASHPNCPTKGDMSPTMLSMIQDLRITERLSIGLTQRFLKERLGANISQSAIVSLTRRTAKFLKLRHFELFQTIRSSPVVYVDETGFYVNGKRIWLWIFTNGKDVLVVIKNSRGSCVIKSILGRTFRGVVVSDCFSAYHRYQNRFNIKFQKCWAHILREARLCAEQTEIGKSVYDEMKRIFDETKSFLSSNPTIEVRQEKYKQLIEWLDLFVSQSIGEKRVQNILKRLGRYRESWFTYVIINGVEPTNNIVERALRQQVILRKLRGSFRSEESVHDHETLSSLFATWNNHGFDPTEQLEKELCRIFEQGIGAK